MHNSENMKTTHYVNYLSNKNHSLITKYIIIRVMIIELCKKYGIHFCLYIPNELNDIMIIMTVFKKFTIFPLSCDFALF